MIHIMAKRFVNGFWVALVMFGALAADRDAISQRSDLFVLAAVGNVLCRSGILRCRWLSRRRTRRERRTGRGLFPDEQPRSALPLGIELRHEHLGAGPDVFKSGWPIDFGGVAVSPGFQGTNGNVITIRFEAKNSGNAALTFNSGSVLQTMAGGQHSHSRRVLQLYHRAACRRTGLHGARAHIRACGQPQRSVARHYQFRSVDHSPTVV